LLDQHIEKCAALITQEHGKTLAEAISSVQRGIDVVDYTCGIPAHLKGSFAEEVATGIDTYSLRQPLGVCVGITPFNFPGMIPLWMFPMAVACGNTFILKPSEKDPSCSLFLAELAKTAGFPDGVINVIQGDSETVNALLIHPLVKAVSFVGSSTVAEHVYKTAITHNKRAQAFGGAKNHCIVMPDADLDIVADQLVAAAYGCAGERCMAISVVIVVGDKTADQLINKMRPLIMQLKVGPGDEQQTDIGPLITQQHWQRVYEYIELGKQEGAQLIIDGSQDKPAAHKTGFFIGACLFDQVKPSMRIYREEIFGPVLCVLRVPDLASGIQLINTHEYGNGAAIFTRDGYTARTFAEQAQAGMIGINAPIPVPVAYHSFGGWKRSFFADIGMYGDEAVRFYTKLKTVTQRWFPPTTEQST
ncbi:MAG TPA: CoA-acylating methylmalonate-semialdehyde dehydrogenase, partial [Gammaproteobacteria bacterium]|nr:CoA-acylating methylmalonate-semialdehyde dehydrogenase [Gammaproteobacteria bacterium]